MIFISPENEYPRHKGDIQDQYPEWDFGQPLPDGWKQVELVEQPNKKSTELIYEEFPKLVDGVYYQNWQVRSMTEDELALRNAPSTVKAKLKGLGFSDIEILAMLEGLVK